MKAHWVGYGLSSYGGFRKLAESGRDYRLWVRSPEKAAKLLGEQGLVGARERIERFDLESIGRALEPGDVVVSMLPVPEHAGLARAALAKRCHFVNTSYMNPDIGALGDAVARAGLSWVVEAGLDPGLDHEFAHRVLERNRDRLLECESFEFFSYCGGFPAEPGEFRYQFSWSPLGVLRALRSPCRWLESGAWRDSASAYAEVRPWSHSGESLEVYPNRDSEPFLARYLDAELRGKCRSFMRGTLRPEGWARAWKETAAQAAASSDPELALLSEKLFSKHAYQGGQKDRVVLSVGIRMTSATGEVSEDRIVLDDRGEFPFGSAMSKWVSETAFHETVRIMDESRDGRAEPGLRCYPA